MGVYMYVVSMHVYVCVVYNYVHVYDVHSVYMYVYNYVYAFVCSKPLHCPLIIVYHSLRHRLCAGPFARGKGSYHIKGAHL